MVSTAGVLQRVNLRLIKEFNFINEKRTEFNRPKLNWNEFTELITKHIKWYDIKRDIVNMENTHE